MSFGKVILLFAGLIALVFTPIMVGHGLSEGNIGRMGIGLVSLAVGAVLVLAHARAMREG